MRLPFCLPTYNVDRRSAMEMLRVGIVPTSAFPPVGSVEVICGQPCVVTGYATREEFLGAVAGAGLDDIEAFQSCPHDLNFIRISTD